MIKFCSNEVFCPFLLCPTGALAETYRLSKVPCLIGTFDGRTMYNSNNASSLPGNVLNHRRMFLDRVFDLRKKQIDNVLQVWNVCGRWPTTVTTDDEQQLRPWSDDHSLVLLYPSTVRR